METGEVWFKVAVRDCNCIFKLYYFSFDYFFLVFLLHMDSQFCDARKAIAEDNEKSLLIFGGVRRREKEEKENNLYWALAVIADASSGELGPLPCSAVMALASLAFLLHPVILRNSMNMWPWRFEKLISSPGSWYFCQLTEIVNTFSFLEP